MTDTKLIKLEKEIEKKITPLEQSNAKAVLRFDLDKARLLAKKLNTIEAQSHAASL